MTTEFLEQAPTPTNDAVRALWLNPPWSAPRREVSGDWPFRSYCRRLPPAKGSRHRQRRPSLARLLREAAKAGVSVARVEITEEKTTLIMGEPEPTEASNPWLADLGKVTKQ